ncbi:DUF4267 domain-containing protein [Virgibacillus oceani]
MTAKTEKAIQIEKKNWNYTSLTFWLSWLFAIGLIALGTNGLIQPNAASQAFGIGITESAASGFVMVKAVRDLALGLTIALFAFVKMKKSLMMLAFVSSIIPFMDGILVITQRGEVIYSLQHFITAIVVLITAFLLWREDKNA